MSRRSPPPFGPLGLGLGRGGGRIAQGRRRQAHASGHGAVVIPADEAKQGSLPLLSPRPPSRRWVVASMSCRGSAPADPSCRNNRDKIACPWNRCDFFCLRAGPVPAHPVRADVVFDPELHRVAHPRLQHTFPRRPVLRGHRQQTVAQVHAHPVVGADREPHDPRARRTISPANVSPPVPQMVRHNAGAVSSASWSAG